MTEYKLAAVRKLIDEWEVDGLMIQSAENRHWLTGFNGSAGWAFVTRDSAILATDGRYWAQAREQAPSFELYEYKREDGAMKKLITSIGVQSLAIEGSHVTLADYHTFKKVDGMKYKPLKQTVEPLRFIKSADEIAKLRAAAAISDYAMAQVNEIVHVGMSEKALAWELEKTMRERGADKIAFDIIVAAGENGARPHHHPTDYKMQLGDAITIDIGATLDGYHSDITRAFHLGENPSDKFWEIYTLVQDALEASTEQLKAGVSGKAVDEVARELFEKAGYGDDFKHSLGHGVGLAVHEGPKLAQTSKDDIPTGAVVTIEPGLYIDGWSGIRIEDLLWVTEDGVEALSRCPKNPIIPVNSEQ